MYDVSRVLIWGVKLVSVANQRVRIKVPRGKYVMKKRIQSLLSHLLLEVLERLRKNVIYLQFLQGQIKKGKEVSTNEGNDRELIINWRECFDRHNKNEDGKRGGFGDLPYHFVVYL